MNNWWKCSIVFIIACFILDSCKKRYEEGPLLIFESPCKRIGNTWKLEHLFIGGIDSTAFMNGVSDSGISFSALRIPRKEGSYNPCGHNDLSIEFIGSGSISGSQKIGDKEKTIKIFTGTLKDLHQIGIKPVGPFFTGESLQFRIKRLTKTELWLDIDYKGNYCWAHFTD